MIGGAIGEAARRRLRAPPAASATGCPPTIWGKRRYLARLASDAYDVLLDDGAIRRIVSERGKWYLCGTYD